MKGFVLFLLPLIFTVGLFYGPFFEEWLYSCKIGFTSHEIHQCLSQPWSESSLIHPQEQCRIVYFHGRGRSLNYNYYFLLPLYRATKCSIIPFEYPGCHAVLTNTTYEALLEAAKEKLSNVISGSSANVYLMGTSMGCSILLSSLPSDYLYNVKGVILENPPTSLSEVASFHTNYYIPSSFVRFMIGERNDWPVKSGILTIAAANWKILVLTSEKDELVPPSMGYKIVAELNKTKNKVTHVVLEGCNHGDAPSHYKYQSSIKSFIYSYVLESTLECPPRFVAPLVLLLEGCLFFRQVRHILRPKHSHPLLVTRFRQAK